MDRLVKDKSVLDTFCTEFCKVVEKHARYIIVSGFLVIASGRSRGTEDIDMIVERMDKARFVKLHEDLVSHGFVCMQSDDQSMIYEDYLTKKTGVRYTFDDKPLPEMEIKFAKDQLDDFQLAHRMKIPLTGLDVWFGSIEMNVAFKEDYLKSEKDIEDAKHLRKMFKVDEHTINEFKKMIRKAR